MRWNFLKPNFLALLLLFLFASCNSHKNEVNLPFDTGSVVQQVAGANKELAIADRELMERYFQRRGWVYKNSGSGLFYSIVQRGQGESVKAGVTVQISYTVSLLNGMVCYGKGIPVIKDFVAGMGKEISGLEEAVLLMKVGDRAIFAIPPHLAYGLLGDEDMIPSRSVIIYDITVVKVAQNS